MEKNSLQKKVDELLLNIPKEHSQELYPLKTIGVYICDISELNPVLRKDKISVYIQDVYEAYKKTKVVLTIEYGSASKDNKLTIRAVYLSLKQTKMLIDLLQYIVSALEREGVTDDE